MKVDLVVLQSSYVAGNTEWGKGRVVSNNLQKTALQLFFEAVQKLYCSFVVARCCG